MRNTFLFSTLIVLSFSASVKAACGRNWEFISETYPSGQQCVQEAFTKQVTWQVNWNDGKNQWVAVIDQGRSNTNASPCVGCWPAFNPPFFVHADPLSSTQWSTFVEETSPGTIVNNQCTVSSIPWRHEYYHDCNPPGGGGNGGGGVCQYDDTGCEDCVADDGLAWQNCRNLEAQWAGAPYCSCSDPSPILVDVSGNGFALTNRANGVTFDLNDDGTKNKIPWTAAATDDAWLCLDRNGNGTIDSGAELFGNFTSQPEPPLGQEKNGFLALAEYDEPSNGGNGDGLITRTDSIFGSLRLWRDGNHNGLSESEELFALQSLNIATLELSYKASRYTDQFGNEFRYRAKVKDMKGTQIGRWMWDVFFVRTP